MSIAEEELGTERAEGREQEQEQEQEQERERERERERAQSGTRGMKER